MNKLFCFLALFILAYSCSSNKEKYEREDLVCKYIVDRDSVFGQYNDYYLLVFRDMKLKCVESHMDFFPDEIILRVRDSLAGHSIFILSDNNYVFLGAQLLYGDKDTRFLFENTSNIIKYGFLFSPILFHIRFGKIKEWKYMAKID